MNPAQSTDPFEDTIAAIATPLGEGGIGIVRLSGPQSLQVVSRVFSPASGANVQELVSHTIYYGHVVDSETGLSVDEAVLLLMRAPRSYTREDVVELQGHGGRAAVQTLLRLVLRHGARLATPGEFTRRAFVNGRLDLAQAEAVLEIVRAKTEAGLKAAMRQLRGGLSAPVQALRGEMMAVLATLEAAVDFPEEGIDLPGVDELEKRIYRIEEGVGALIRKAREGRLLRDGATVVIAGRPNVGKSSLLNAILGRDRAIVSVVPGTTRDTVEEEFCIGGIPATLVDTAGIRLESADPVEAEGVRRARGALEHADLTLVVVDGSEGIRPLDVHSWSEAKEPRMLVVNKSDLPPALSPGDYTNQFGVRPLFTSALRGRGVEELRAELKGALGAEAEGEAIAMVGPRHREALERAERQVLAARKGMGDGLSLEFVALEVRGAIDALGEILGETATEEVLDRVFRDFCIGK